MIHVYIWGWLNQGCNNGGNDKYLVPGYIKNGCGSGMEEESPTVLSWGTGKIDLPSTEMGKTHMEYVWGERSGV